MATTCCQPPETGRSGCHGLDVTIKHLPAQADWNPLLYPPGQIVPVPLKTRRIAESQANEAFTGGLCGLLQLSIATLTSQPRRYSQSLAMSALQRESSSSHYLPAHLLPIENKGSC